LLHRQDVSSADVNRATANQPTTQRRAMPERFSYKHASLTITPEQNQLVYEHLFAAIADVLGEAATPEVAAAWSEVYWTMADTLVDIENDLYRASDAPDRDTWRTHRIVARYRERSEERRVGRERRARGRRA